jgi:TRAP-type mannitol/chloroaromatic compound transport system permease small subunit
MLAISRLAGAINLLNRIIGEICSWFSLAIVLVCFTVVFQRYVLGVSYLWMQDLYVWLNGAMFMLVAGFALMRDEHVRVDIFYRPASIRKKAIIDLIGVFCFILPFAAVVLIYGYAAIARSWGLLEASSNVGGMPGLFILKSCILAFAILTSLQGIAMAARSVLVLADREDLVAPSFRYRTDKD